MNRIKKKENNKNVNVVFLHSDIVFKRFSNSCVASSSAFYEAKFFNSSEFFDN